MHNKWFLLFIVICCTTVSCDYGKRNRVWTQYYSPDSAYSIIIPHVHDTGTVVTDTEFGKLKKHYLEWVWILSQSFYSQFTTEVDIKFIGISYIDIPEELALPDARILDSCIKSNLQFYTKETDRFIIPVTNITLSGYPGKYVVVELDTIEPVRKVFYIKRYLAGRRLYKLEVIAYSGSYRQQEVDSFFNSFRILD